MNPDEVADAPGDVTTRSQRYQWQSGAGRVIGWHEEIGLTLYYGVDERLRGVAVDALCGPQVVADGMALVARAPSAVERWMLERAEKYEPCTELLYMSAGVPGSESLGVVVSAQRAGDHLLTRPVFVPAEGMDDVSAFLPEQVWVVQ
ncbi:hypothetical protein [Streptodolium elevatio]|uniref:Uncharacterized protein n=1 Tax=Streptodolium elevatio TaxID=3157996 RepID=A0ABV3DRV9_9ACTN